MPRRTAPVPDGVVVARVAARGAAERAGLRAGDRILAINGEPLRDVIALDLTLFLFELDGFVLVLENVAVRAFSIGQCVIAAFFQRRASGEIL